MHVCVWGRGEYVVTARIRGAYLHFLEIGTIPFTSLKFDIALRDKEPVCLTLEGTFPDKPGAIQT